MGREIRKVPADWNHPKKENGSYHPMFDDNFNSACQKWYAECIKNNGKATDASGAWFHECKGDPPNIDTHRIRDWTTEEATHIQMYETVSEGTPVSPVFATREELIDYLCVHGDFWDQQRRKEGCTLIRCTPWSRQNAISFVNSSFALSGIITNGKMYGPSEQGELVGK
jgi:hypothetical protein